VMQQPSNKGEYFLTDAFQYMIDKGAKIKVVDVEGWHDAGKIDTLLASNRTMLEQRKMARRPDGLPHDAKIVEPVYIEDGATVKDSTVGPNVSIGAGTVVEGSTLTHTIVGAKSKIRGATLTNSLVGDEVVLEGVKGEVTVGDHSEIRVK